MEFTKMPFTEEEITVWKLSMYGQKRPSLKREEHKRFINTKEYRSTELFNKMDTHFLEWVSHVYRNWPGQVTMVETSVEDTLGVICFGVKVGTFDTLDLLAATLNKNTKLKRVF